MSSTTKPSTARPRTSKPRSSTVLRWIHLLAGLLISVYFLFMPDGGWPPAFETFVGQFVVALVAWTGIIRWQLPRYRRWRARRRAAASAA